MLVGKRKTSFTMAYRYIFLVASMFVFWSCQPAEPNEGTIQIEYSAGPDQIAEDIVTSDLFIEATAAIKEYSLASLKEVRNGATSLNEDQLAALKLTSDRSKIYAENGYENAEEITQISQRVDLLTDQLLVEFEHLKAAIGAEKFEQVLNAIEANHSDMYRLSSTEGLSILN